MPGNQNAKNNIITGDEDLIPVKEYENVMEKIFNHWCGTFQLLFACLMVETGERAIDQSVLFKW